MQNAPGGVSEAGSKTVETGAENVRIESMEFSPQEEITLLDGKIADLDKQITGMQNNVLKDKYDIANEAMRNLGLSQLKNPTNDQKALQDKIVVREKLIQKRMELSGGDKLPLSDEAGGAEEEIFTPEEKRNLIEVKKAEILGKKIEKFFELFENLKEADKKAMKESGHMIGDPGMMETLGMGKIDPEVVKKLVQLFEAGIKLLPEILKRCPELMEQMNEQLEKEAKEIVDREIAEAKKKTQEETVKEKDQEKRVPEPDSEEGLEDTDALSYMEVAEVSPEAAPETASSGPVPTGK